MRRDARFWRNVALITLVHVVALIALLRWVGASKVESAQEITWLNADEDTSASVAAYLTGLVELQYRLETDSSEAIEPALLERLSALRERLAQALRA